VPTNQRLAEMIAERRLDDLDDPIWEGCAEGRFVLHRCQSCGGHYWPASSCVQHGSSSMEWVPATGHGVVHTYVVVHRTHDPDYRGETPYVGVVVLLDEDVMVHGAMADSRRQVAIGQEVHIVFDRTVPGVDLPRFAPASDQHTRGTR